MATFEAARNKYQSDAVHTMSPGLLIVALYDRVLLDLERALTAISENDVFGAHSALVHAQEIVYELLASLDLKRWPGGASLAAIYTTWSGSRTQEMSALISIWIVACPMPKRSCRLLTACTVNSSPGWPFGITRWQVSATSVVLIGQT